MAQTTPDASSSQNSDSSNATQYMPNTGMHMDQVSWPQHPYIPYLVYVPAHPYYPYGVPPPWTHSAPSPHAPDAPSSGVGAGVPHHTSQAGQDGYCPSPVADVSGANPPPKHPSAPPLYQPSPSGNLGSPPPSVPQTPNSSVGRKRVGEDVQERDAKRTKTACGKMEDDPLFKPVLNRLGLPNGTFVCSKDGMVLNPESYLKHIKTKMHLGYKLEKFKCPVCSRTYTRIDNCKRHFNDGQCGKSAAGGPPPSFSISKASTSSASTAPGTASTTPFKFVPVFTASMSQSTQIAEAAEGNEDDEDAGFREANEIQDI